MSVLTEKTKGNAMNTTEKTEITFEIDCRLCGTEFDSTGGQICDACGIVDIYEMAE